MPLNDYEYDLSQPTVAQPAFDAPPRLPGIGLAPAPARPGLADTSTDADLQALPGVAKAGLALQAFGAGMQGKEPLINQVAQEKRRDKLMQYQSFKMNNEALDDSVKMVKGLRGDARTSFIEQQAKNLDKMNPQLGATFRSLAEKPDMANMIAKYGQDMPELKMAFDLGGEEAVYKLMQSEKFYEFATKRADIKELPMVSQKVRTMIAALPQFNPELQKKFMKDGVIDRAELDELNDAVSKHPEFGKLALTAEQMAALNRNDEVALAGLPVLTGKKTQELAIEKAKRSDDAPKTRTRMAGTNEVQEEWNGEKWVPIGSGPRFKPGEDPASAIRSAAQANKDRDTELRLSDDYARDTKGFKDLKAKFSAASQYYAGVAEGKAPTPADDRALVFTYAKMLDPGDKVAVKDVQDIQKLAGVPQRVVQGVQNIVKGNLLPPEVRKDMYATIRKEFTQHNRAQAGLEQEYTARGQRYKLDSRNIVIPHSMKLDD